jgi:phage terminase large subunit GpA-like protein
MTDMDDYKKDGIVDWKAFHDAQIASGEICSSCKTYIFIGAKGSPRICRQCQDLKDKLYESVEHSFYIRCPHCGHVFDVNQYATEIDDLQIFDSHDAYPVMCPECEKEFDVQVHVNYEFQSPPVKNADKNT